MDCTDAAYEPAERWLQSGVGTTGSAFPRDGGMERSNTPAGGGLQGADCAQTGASMSAGEARVLGSGSVGTETAETGAGMPERACAPARRRARYSR